MFLRTGKMDENIKGKRSAPPLSITLRLTIVYIISALGILALSTAFLYWVLVTNLTRKNDEFLADKIHILRYVLLHHPNEIEPLKEEVRWGTRFKYYARILDEDGNTLLETPGMRGFIARASFPVPVKTTEAPKEALTWKSPDGGSYFLMSAQAELGDSGGKRYVLQVALNATREEAVLDDYRRKILIVLIVGLLNSGAAGAVVVYTAMHPLREMTWRVRQITAEHLNKRISSKQWPKEMVALSASLDEMLNSLEDSFDRLSKCSADLAHELRTPINNLMGEASVALAKLRTPEEYQDILESSLEEYERLSRLINGLLFLARAENPETQIERVQFDAAEEIKAVLDFHDAVARDQGVETLVTGNAVLNADIILFRRALSNLISNALRHTPSGGKISISARQSEQGIKIIINDTGSGISPEHLPRIFDRFYRIDCGRSQDSGGSGLGLAIVKTIMNMHGGTISVESQVGTGTSVTLGFPPNGTL